MTLDYTESLKSNYKSISNHSYEYALRMVIFYLQRNPIFSKRSEVVWTNILEVWIKNGPIQTMWIKKYEMRPQRN